MTPVRLEPATLRSRVKHSTTEPLRSLYVGFCLELYFVNFCNQVAEEERAGCFALIVFDGMCFDVLFSQCHELVCYCGISR